MARGVWRERRSTFPDAVVFQATADAAHGPGRFDTCSRQGGIRVCSMRRDQAGQRTRFPEVTLNRAWTTECPEEETQFT